MDAVVRAVRGATTIDHDRADHVAERTQELVRTLMSVNGLAADDIVSMIFSVTPDIVSAFPATAARLLGLDDVPLLGTVEAAIEGAPERCVRVLAHVYTTRTRAEINHVYLAGAADMRAKLASQIAQ